MCERVVTADWLENIGEIGGYSTWCEVSMALTYTEVPGNYINVASGKLLSFDNIKAEILKISPKYIELQLNNPTNQLANIKVYLDEKGSMSKSIGSLSTVIMVILKPGESCAVKLTGSVSGTRSIN